MKKALTLIAFVALASVALSSTLFTAKDPKPGVVNIKGNANGRIASIDVFSTVPDGTVSISRIFNYSNYTNVYDTTTKVRTNQTQNAIYGNFRLKDQNGVIWDRVAPMLVRNGQEIGDIYYPRGRSYELKPDGSLTQLVPPLIEYDPQWYSGRNAYYYFESEVNITRAPYVVADSLPESLSFTVGSETKTFSRVGDIVGYEPGTNVVTTTVTTNEIRKVKTYDLAVTNVIYSGTCTNNCLHGVPNDVWLFSSDKLIFDGTATGGELRIVIE